MIHSTPKKMLLLLGIPLTLGCSSMPIASHHEEPIIEVRVYKVAAGKMDEWERFFHDKLVEPQEKAGIKILTAYCTLGDENLFVWSRQFSGKANMAEERAAFYQSDLWKNNLRPELKERGFIEKVEIVYTVRPSMGDGKG
ncbi:NIPSNAP family protein [Planctomycetota bacterium]